MNRQANCALVYCELLQGISQTLTAAHGHRNTTQWFRTRAANPVTGKVTSLYPCSPSPQTCTNCALWLCFKSSTKDGTLAASVIICSRAQQSQTQAPSGHKMSQPGKLTGRFAQGRREHLWLSFPKTALSKGFPKSEAKLLTCGPKAACQPAPPEFSISLSQQIEVKTKAPKG